MKTIPSSAVFGLANVPGGALEVHHQMEDGQDAPVSEPSTGAWRYNDATKAFEFSVDGGPWGALVDTVVPTGPLPFNKPVPGDWADPGIAGAGVGIVSTASGNLRLSQAPIVGDTLAYLEETTGLPAAPFTIDVMFAADYNLPSNLGGFGFYVRNSGGATPDRVIVIQAGGADSQSYQVVRADSPVGGFATSYFGGLRTASAFRFDVNAGGDVDVLYTPNGGDFILLATVAAAYLGGAPTRYGLYTDNHNGVFESGVTLYSVTVT